MKLVASFLVFALALSACSSPYTLKSSQVLNNADFSKYKTFKIVPPANGEVLPAGMSLGDFQNLSTAVAEQLTLRGFTLTNNNPDLLVGLALSVKQTVETKDALPPGAYGYRAIGPRAAYVQSYYQDAQIISDIYTEGQMAIDMVDVAKNIHAFSSVTSTIIDGSGKKIKDLDQLKQAAAVAFSKFPVSAPKK